GPAGPQGIPGGVLSYADFYALMPPDNAATVAPGTDVSFPQNGAIANTNIGRLGPASFNLGPIGTYQILFQVGVTEAGQLILTLNDEDLPETVVGRATGTSQIVGMSLVTTTTVNSVLTVRNPAGNAAALTITPLAGGTRPVSAHLVITQLG
ncbi:MAG: collagen-like protein, partial [Clostridia bacterium]|nr:collagen-like protein [Clostridia bacterium]